MQFWEGGIEPVVVGEYTLKKHLDQYYEAEDDKMKDILGDLLDEEIEFVEEQEDDVSVAALQEQTEKAHYGRYLRDLLTTIEKEG